MPRQMLILNAPLFFFYFFFDPRVLFLLVGQELASHTDKREQGKRDLALQRSEGREQVTRPITNRAQERTGLYSQ